MIVLLLVQNAIIHAKIAVDLLIQNAQNVTTLLNYSKDNVLRIVEDISLTVNALLVQKDFPMSKQL